MSLQNNRETIDFYQIGFNQVRQSIFDRDAVRNSAPALWQELRESGFFSELLVQGKSINSIVAQFSDFSKGCLDIPFVVSVGAQIIAAELIKTYGSPLQKDKYLNSVIDGSCIAAICNSESGAGTNLKAMNSRYTVETGGSKTGLVDIKKRVATNAGQANLALCSLLDLSQANGRPVVEVVLIDASKQEQADITPEMAGFWTGMTGSIYAERPNVKLEDIRLGEAGAGFEILRYCYNLERLLLAAAVAGHMEGLAEIALDFVLSTNSTTVQLHDKQYIQEKILEIHTCSVKLNSIIDSIVDNGVAINRNDDNLQNRLSTLKLIVIEEGGRASRAFFEIFGFTAYTTTHIAQKSERDFLALQYLGGSKEQQKILLFDQLVRSRQNSR